MKPLINPSDPIELDAFQKGFVFWEHPKPKYLHRSTMQNGGSGWMDSARPMRTIPTAWTQRRERQCRRPSIGCWKGIRRYRR
jgi:hypothetical protein